VHVAPAASDPPEIPSVVPPAAALAVALAHVVAALGALAITTPDGSVSVSARLDNAIAPDPVFAMVTVNVDVVPATIDVGLNALLMVTGGATVNTALAGAEFVAPCVDDNEPVATVFVYVPADAAVTSTVTVHVPLAATEPPESATEPAPLTAVTVPPVHVVAAFGVLAIVTPEGNASVNAIPLSATAPEAVFAIVSVSSDVPPGAIVIGAKLFVNVTFGAFAIVNVAVAGAVLLIPCVVVSAPAGIVFV
jgi:hypothetical protein